MWFGWPNYRILEGGVYSRDCTHGPHEVGVCMYECTQRERPWRTWERGKGEGKPNLMEGMRVRLLAVPSNSVTPTTQQIPHPGCVSRLTVLRPGPRREPPYSQGQRPLLLLAMPANNTTTATAKKKKHTRLRKHQPQLLHRAFSLVHPF